MGSPISFSTAWVCRFTNSRSASKASDSLRGKARRISLEISGSLRIPEELSTTRAIEGEANLAILIPAQHAASGPESQDLGPTCRGRKDAKMDNSTLRWTNSQY